MKLALAPSLRAQILDEARAASPRECCGLILGRRSGEQSEALALHPARNMAARDDRFDIAPEDHFAAQRQARSVGQAVIGCYHSHPGGAPKPSPFDLAGATEENFFWLIAAEEELAAFVYCKGLLTGADLVTSST